MKMFLNLIRKQLLDFVLVEKLCVSSTIKHDQKSICLPVQMLPFCYLPKAMAEVYLWKSFIFKCFCVSLQITVLLSAQRKAMTPQILAGT